jgi:hypothetical protein
MIQIVPRLRIRRRSFCCEKSIAKGNHGTDHRILGPTACRRFSESLLTRPGKNEYHTPSLNTVSGGMARAALLLARLAGRRGQSTALYLTQRVL